MAPFSCSQLNHVFVSKQMQNYSSWAQLNGAMPQGSWLGPLSFLVLINNLEVGCLAHKYVDDTTLTEVIHDSKLQ